MLLTQDSKTSDQGFKCTQLQPAEILPKLTRLHPLEPSSLVDFARNSRVFVCCSSLARLFVSPAELALLPLELHQSFYSGTELPQVSTELRRVLLFEHSSLLILTADL